eukprot:jgi/Ulvmu1/7410/UM036_0070.1
MATSTSGRNDDAMPLRAALCVATAVALASIFYGFLRFGKRVHVLADSRNITRACTHASSGCSTSSAREWTVGADVDMLNMLRVRNAAGILPAEAAAAAGRADHRALIDLVASPEAFVALEAAGGGGKP